MWSAAAGTGCVASAEDARPRHVDSVDGRCTSQHMVAHAHGSVDAPICGPPQAMLSSARTSCDAQYVDIAQVQRYGEGLMYRVKFRARIDRND